MAVIRRQGIENWSLSNWIPVKKISSRYSVAVAFCINIWSLRQFSKIDLNGLHYKVDSTNKEVKCIDYDLNTKKSIIYLCSQNAIP